MVWDGKKKLLKMKLTACEEDNNPIYISGNADAVVLAPQLPLVHAKIPRM